MRKGVLSSLMMSTASDSDYLQLQVFRSVSCVIGVCMDTPKSLVSHENKRNIKKQMIHARVLVSDQKNKLANVICCIWITEISRGAMLCSIV